MVTAGVLTVAAGFVLGRAFGLTVTSPQALFAFVVAVTVLPLMMRLTVGHRPFGLTAGLFSWGFAVPFTFVALTTFWVARAPDQRPHRIFVVGRPCPDDTAPRQQDTILENDIIATSKTAIRTGAGVLVCLCSVRISTGATDDCGGRDRRGCFGLESRASAPTL